MILNKLAKTVYTIKNNYAEVSFLQIRCGDEAFSMLKNEIEKRTAVSVLGGPFSYQGIQLVNDDKLGVNDISFILEYKIDIYNNGKGE